MTPFGYVLFGILLAVVVIAVTNIVLEIRENRVPRARISAHYFNHCGDGCNVRRSA